MINYSEEIFTKDFSNENSKQAYLSLCKWLAQNIYSKNFSNYIQTKITKKEKCKIPTFNLKIFVCIDLEEKDKEFCYKCKTMHQMFYCLDKMNCNECKYNAFKKKIENEIKYLKEEIKEKIK